MKVYKQSKVNFILYMIIDVILLCPTLGLWVFVLMYHIMQYNSNTLTLGEQSIIMRTGIFNSQLHEIRYSKINSVIVSRSFLGSVYGYGNITIFSGNDISGLLFKDIDSPEKVKKEIDAMIEDA